MPESGYIAVLEVKLSVTFDAGSLVLWGTSSSVERQQARRPTAGRASVADSPTVNLHEASFFDLHLQFPTMCSLCSGRSAAMRTLLF